MNNKDRMALHKVNFEDLKKVDVRTVDINKNLFDKLKTPIDLELVR